MDQGSVRDILAGKTYFIRTFGCQMNQHDSERVYGMSFGGRDVKFRVRGDTLEVLSLAESKQE